jgi:biopolymer transport protein ExbB
VRLAPAPSGAIAGGAQKELNRSIAELNDLRESIAAEKLPLATRLTELEESVIALRKEGEQVQRLVDAGALEIGTLTAEIRSRKDELTYITGLLDEYVRNFETKIGVGEAQLYGAAVLATKQAVENTTLVPQERFATQTGFVDLTARRLAEVIGGTRFAGIGVDTLGTVLNGQYALIGPVSLFRSETGVSGIAVPQPGSENPLVRPLEGDLAGAVDVLIASGSGTLPLDASRGGALKALVQKTNLMAHLREGRPHHVATACFRPSQRSAVVIERVAFPA